MKQSRELYEIVDKVQRGCGYEFSEKELLDIHAYTVRKCEVNGKGDDYVPILFENELTDYLMRKAINIAGGANRCAKCATTALA